MKFYDKRGNLMDGQLATIRLKLAACRLAVFIKAVTPLDPIRDFNGIAEELGVTPQYAGRALHAAMVEFHSLMVAKLHEDSKFDKTINVFTQGSKMAVDFGKPRPGQTMLNKINKQRGTDVQKLYVENYHLLNLRLMKKVAYRIE